jgi:hypothetical protein
MVFQCQTTGGGAQPGANFVGRSRIGGWTEFWNVSGDDLVAAQTACFGPRTGGQPAMCQARAALLPKNSTLLGVRFYGGGSGKGVFVSRSFAGSFDNTNAPQVGLLCRTNTAGASAVRRFRIQNLPDSQETKGEYNPTEAFAAAVEKYFSSLDGFSFRGQFKDNVTAIDKIGTDGTVHLLANNPFALNSMVTVTNSVDDAGNRNGYTAKVIGIGPGAMDVKLDKTVTATWKGGTAFNGGKSNVAAGPVGQTPSVVKLAIRKIGRPSDPFRGRKSRKRQK